MSFHPRISDDELLALVEQRAIAPGRQAEIRAAFDADPRLVKLIRSMRRDAGVLAGLGDADHAPAGLVEDVEAGLEREALLGLSAASAAEAAAPTAIPVSRLTPARPDAWEPLKIFTRSAWTRRLAAAAALLLVVTAGYLTIRAALPAKPSKTLARSNETPADTTITPKPTITAVKTSPEPTGLSMPDDIVVGPQPIVDERAVAAAAVREAEHQREVDLARISVALVAAQEGRLVARIKPAKNPLSLAQVSRRLEAMTAVRGGGVMSVRLNKLSNEDSGVAVALVQQHMTDLANKARSPRIDPLPVNTPDRPVASADGTGNGNRGGEFSLAPTPTQPPEVGPMTLDAKAFAASAPATEQGLRQLLRQLAGNEATIELDIVETPWQTATAGVPMDANTIFWWSMPSAAWGGRVTVPVVVQTSP